MQKSFDQLITEANQASMIGWDFSFLTNRWVESPLSWDLKSRIQTLFSGVSSMVDMGTGGGEFLRSLMPLPENVTATEGYAPNVAVARRNLEPLGIEVVDITAGPGLPFRDQQFGFIMNRHEEYEPAEVWRVLKPGGHFITQQVGGQDLIGIHQLLQEEVYFKYDFWDKAYATAELEVAGFQIKSALEEFPEVEIYDVGAIVFMLNNTPWKIEDFSVDRYYGRLQKIHEKIQQEGKLIMKSHRFVIEAVRPAS